MTPDELSATIQAALEALVARGQVVIDGPLPVIEVERPRSKEHGDYATSVALQLAKRARMSPRSLAELLAAELKAVDVISAVDVAGPGFLNLTVATGAQGEVARAVVTNPDYGRGDELAGRRINMEFVSANPTGPVTLASTRWAAMGDSLTRLLRAQGAEVGTEYYFNDAGAQIDRFAASLDAAAHHLPTPTDGYAGDYVGEVAQRVVDANPGLLDRSSDEVLDIFRTAGVAFMFDEVKETLHGFGVDFDVYFSERSLHESGAVDRAVERLRGGGLTYEADGAIWLRSTDYGDDKDRVIIRSDGRPTYICADAAYYLDKRNRGFDRVVILLGADHHGYLGRYRALAAAFGDDPDQTLELIIGQLVNLLRDGVPVRMSKRAGTVLTLGDLVDAVGTDAARYALVRYSSDSTIDIDLDLWTRQNAENPVYYVQYAHARVSTLVGNAHELGIDADVTTFRPAELSHDRERVLLRSLADLPAVVQSAAELREPHRVARYLESTASAFHKWYEEPACRVLPRADEEPSDAHRARLLLALATRQVIATGLDLLGVSAPERM